MKQAPSNVESKGILLAAIAREIRERASELLSLELEMDSFSQDELIDRRRTSPLQAEAAVHRRSLRRARMELERLGYQDTAVPAEFLHSVDRAGLLMLRLALP